MGNWEQVWLIFAAYALVVFILFTILFRYKHQPERITLNEVSEQGGGNPEGMVD